MSQPHLRQTGKRPPIPQRVDSKLDLEVPVPFSPVSVPPALYKRSAKDHVFHGTEISYRYSVPLELYGHTGPVVLLAIELEHFTRMVPFEEFFEDVGIVVIKDRDNAVCQVGCCESFHEGFVDLDLGPELDIEHSWVASSLRVIKLGVIYEVMSVFRN